MMTAFNRIEFGARVLAAMNGRSCRDVAREAGVSAATLNRVTRGEMPSVPVYLTLSEWLTPSQVLDAATVERRRKALREALEHVDNIAGEMNGAAERAHLIDADDAAMNLADAFGVEFAPGWEDEVAALATDPHQHGGKGA